MDANAVTSRRTGSQRTGRLSNRVGSCAVSNQAQFLTVCSGGHCPPKWNSIIQASPALFFQGHSFSGDSEWNSQDDTLELYTWTEMLGVFCCCSLPLYPYFTSFWKWHWLINTKRRSLSFCSQFMSVAQCFNIKTGLQYIVWTINNASFNKHF